jgi:hypothetical protein
MEAVLRKHFNPQIRVLTVSLIVLNVKELPLMNVSHVCLIYYFTIKPVLTKASVRLKPMNPHIIVKIVILHV